MYPVILAKTVETARKSCCYVNYFHVSKNIKTSFAGFSIKLLLLKKACNFNAFSYVQNCVESVYNFLKTHFGAFAYVKYFS